MPLLLCYYILYASYQVIDAISGDIGNQIIIQYGMNATGVPEAVNFIQSQVSEPRN